MERFGTFSEEEFLAICNLLGTSCSSPAANALREKFKRVFGGDGTAEEAGHVTALLEQLRKGTPS